MLVKERYLYGTERLGTIYGTNVIATWTTPPSISGPAFSTALEMHDHLGNVRATFSGIAPTMMGGGSPVPTSINTVNYYHYYAFGAPHPNRYYEPFGSNHWGFNGQERKDDLRGIGNSYDYGSRNYDSRIARLSSLDPQAQKLPSLSPYSFCINSPIIAIDPDGEFPILVNGKVGKSSERGSAKYWNPGILSAISSKTGYKLSEFKFVDGDKGFWAGTRKSNGMAIGKADAQSVYQRLKKTMKNGEITENLQVFSHSRGGAFANGYMKGLKSEVLRLAQKEGVKISGGKSLIEYSINLAPHQSNSLAYDNDGSKNVTISHIGDLLSGNDAKGNTINVHSVPNEDGGLIAQHESGSFVKELNIVLDALKEAGNDMGTLFNKIKDGFKKYDESRSNGDKSNVSKGSE